MTTNRYFRNIVTKILYESNIDPKTYLKYKELSEMYTQFIDQDQELLRKVLHDYIDTLSEDQLKNILVSDSMEEGVSEERNQRLLATQYLTQIKIICSNPGNIYLNAKNEYTADSHFFPLQLKFNQEKKGIDPIKCQKTYAELKNVGYELYIMYFNCITNIKTFPNEVQLLPITSGELDNIIFHELIHTLDYEEERNSGNIPIPFVGYGEGSKGYFNEPHEYHAISQTILNNIDKLTPDQKMELSKHQIIEPRELGLNNWIDKFVRNVLDKAIPKDQRPFYDQFMKNLNRVHLKDFIDKIIDLLVDNKWIKVLDLQEESVILEYPKSI